RRVLFARGYTGNGCRSGAGGNKGACKPARLARIVEPGLLRDSSWRHRHPGGRPDERTSSTSATAAPRAGTQRSQRKPVPDRRLRPGALHIDGTTAAQPCTFVEKNSAHGPGTTSGGWHSCAGGKRLAVLAAPTTVKENHSLGQT